MITSRLFFSPASRAAAVGCVLASAASAQQVNASAQAFGMGGNFTARARGVHAVAWNPANLGLSGNPGFSMQLGSVFGASSLQPIALGDFKRFEGQAIPAAQREDWINQVTANGGETGSGDVGLGAFGMSVGPLAFQLSATALASATLSPDAVEMVFFGNAGRTGTVRNFNLAGAKIDAAAFATGAVSFGHGFAVGLGELAFGVTGKYIAGSVAMARDNGSAINTNDIQILFPAVYADSSGIAGSGIGWDVGVSWRARSTTIGVSVQNAVNSFAWDAAKLRSGTAAGYFTVDSSGTTFDEDQPYSAAPQSMRDAVAAYVFKPTVAIGLAREVASRLTVTADARQQLGEDGSIQIGPKTQAGMGLELRIIPFIPLRAGATYLTGGYGVSGGAGLKLSGFELGAAIMVRDRGAGRESGVMVSLVNVR